MEARYFQWRGRHGEQFIGKGVGFYTDDPNSSHREVDWSRKDVVVLSSAGGAGRLVNNEAILAARADARSDLRHPRPLSAQGRQEQSL